MINDVLHILIGTVEEIDIVKIESATLWESEKLLHHNRHPVIAFHQGSISCYQSSVKLKSWNLDGKVEGSDETHISERPSVPCWCLAVIVSSYIERLLEEPGVISSEVLKESSCYNNLTPHLSRTFRHNSLGELDKIFFNFWFSHFCSDFQENLSELHISIDISNGIMQSVVRNFSLRGNIGIKLLLTLRQAVEEEVTIIKRVNDGFGFGRFFPFSIEEILDSVGVASWDLPGIDSGPLGNSREAVFVSK